MQAEITLRQAAQQALDDICGAKLCEFNSMSSRHEMVRLMDSAITALRAALAEPEQNPFGDDAGRYARKLHEEREAYKALLTEHKSQTTHWEGCEAVHPECKEKNT